MGSRNNEEWKKNADTHKMTAEEVKAAGVEGSMRGPGQSPGGILHQRKTLPFSFTTMALVGLVMTGAIGYSVLYTRKKHDATAMDVAKVSVGTATPQDTKPRK